MEHIKDWLSDNLPKCSISHASGYAEICKRAMNYALSMEYTLNNPLSALASKRDKTKDVIHIEKEELQLIIDADFDRLIKEQGVPFSSSTTEVV